MTEGRVTVEMEGSGRRQRNEKGEWERRMGIGEGRDDDSTKK